jgi:hypothetical protein
VVGSVAADDRRVQATVPGPGAVIAEGDVILISIWRYQAPGP